MDRANIDPSTIKWDSVHRVKYLIFQSFRYEYISPIKDLKHRLMVIPPEHFGDQDRLSYDLTIKPDGAKVNSETDERGNLVTNIEVSLVESSLEFKVNIEVERHANQPHYVDSSAYWLSASLLTSSDDQIRSVAQKFKSRGLQGLDLAQEINNWVHSSLLYRSSDRGINITASEILASGFGVCQHYAHLMLAMCRACSLPARYISGHVVGENESHAWVEVILPSHGSGKFMAIAFDPTYGEEAGLDHITIASGLDYQDISPTRGWYSVPVGMPVEHRLESYQRVTLLEVDQ